MSEELPTIEVTETVTRADRYDPILRQVTGLNFPPKTRPMTDADLVAVLKAMPEGRRAAILADVPLVVTDMSDEAVAAWMRRKGAPVEDAPPYRRSIIWEAALAVLREQANARLAPKWIPVGERMPDAGTIVIVWFVSDTRRPGNTMIARRDALYGSKSGDPLRWFGNGTWIDNDQITHWQPLPEPPGGE